MERRANDETIVVSDGLFLKDMDGVLHCYFRLNGKQFRKSTKTNDLATVPDQRLWDKNLD